MICFSSNVSERLPGRATNNRAEIHVNFYRFFYVCKENVKWLIHHWNDFSNNIMVSFVYDLWKTIYYILNFCRQQELLWNKPKKREWEVLQLWQIANFLSMVSCQYQHYYHVTAQFDRYRTDKTVYNLLIFSGITSWIHKWKKNGWTLSDNTKVKNEEDWKSLDSEMQGIDVKFVRILVSTVSSVKSVEYLIKNSWSTDFVQVVHTVHNYEMPIYHA